MSFIEDIVIPGEKGRIFLTSVDKTEDLMSIKSAIEKIEGITEVSVNIAVFPTEFHIVVDVVVDVNEIGEVVNELGFHLLPKSNL
ncbi:hypothetical protein NBRC110019_05550 [Neptunitalea chrysea]|uniref:Uncharacterized protein n=1 Tax=Neptunitalea chrysea TaxID=1647581 RepID=A0A9W6EUB8_9FLAO|nr:heavy-metal-associated domain-containing protein [Neptunitalea chrysea]GLB51516.1 hypothetical protein NBRC110019_05550 [Neptunitalea chrysea]